MPKWGESQYTAAGDAANAGYGLAGFDAVVATIGALIAEGKVRHWGVSNETTYGLCQLHAACVRLGVPPPVSIQNDFSLCFRTFEGELAEACSPDHHNLALLAYGVLNGGILSGKYLGARHPALANATKASPKVALMAVTSMIPAWEVERALRKGGSRSGNFAGRINERILAPSGPFSL